MIILENQPESSNKIKVEFYAFSEKKTVWVVAEPQMLEKDEEILKELKRRIIDTAYIAHTTYYKNNEVIAENSYYKPFEIQSTLNDKITIKKRTE